MNKQILSILLFLLAGCSADKIPLEGAREPFIAVSENAKPDHSIANILVQVPQAINCKDWPQVGGNVTHNMPPAKLNKDLKLAWKQEIGRGSSDSQRLICGVIVTEGIVYSTDAKGEINARKLSDGSLLWSINTILDEDKTEDAMGGGLGHDGGILYATNSFGHVLAIDPKDGKIIWQKSLNSPIRSAPTIHNQRLFIVTINNELHVLEAKDGNKIWDYSGIVEPSALLGGANPAVTDEVVITAFSSGEVYALQVANGHPIWSETLTPAVRIDSVSSIPHIRARPIINEEVVYVVSHGGRMTAIDLKNGQRIWQKDIGGVRTPAIGGDFLFLITSNNDLVCLLKKTGQVRWAISMPKGNPDEPAVLWAGPVLVNDQLTVCGTNGTVQFISIKDGSIVSALTFEGSALLSPVVADETLLILTEEANLHAWR